MSLLNIEQGELVVADIMFAEQTETKRRLALVVSNTDFNANSKDIVVLKVTSKNRHNHFNILISNENTAKKMLKKASTIRADFPVTIAKEKILSRPDKISQQKLTEVKQKIKEFYEL